MSKPDYPSAPPFPDEFAPAQKKEKAPYGLQAAKAMYYSQNRFGYRLFNRDEKIDALFELAQGRNSTDNIRKMFGFHDDQNSTQDDQGALAYIDIQTINLATSYVNRAVAKLQRNKYEIGLSAIDPLSVDEAKQMQAKLATYYLLKDWMATNNLDPQKFFPDLDIPNLPNYPDELLFQLSTNVKIQKVIDGEKTIKLVNNVINDIQQQLRECDWDLVVAGRAHLHCYLDENFMPRVERVNPKFWGGSYVDNEDYSKAEYQFFIEFITKNQFKKEAEDKLTKEEIETVLGSFTYANAITSVGTLPEYYQFYDGLDYIPVMRFYFLSNDARSYARWKNDSGYLMIDERKPDWKPSQDATTKREVIRTNVTSVYGGTWVIDSDIVYDYGRRSIPRTNLVNTRLPIITFAPNMKNGRVVSLLAQMVEPLTMFNVAWNKVKDILAKGRMNVWELNLTAFENVALGKGGQAWTPREAMDFLFQTNMAVTRQNTNQYGQSNGQAVREMASGLQLTDYFTTMSQCVMILDKLTASSVVEQGQIPDRLAVGAMKASIAAGTEGVEYLINGHRQLYQQSTHMLLLLTQEAKRNKIAIQGMIPALGTFTTEYFEVPDTLPYCEYGLMMETEPTEEEWMMFYSEIQVAVQEGRLNSSDSAFIRQIKNLKQARFIMANRERINERKAMEMRAQEQQFQSQLQDKTAQDKLNLEMQILEKKKQDETELIALKGKIDEYLQNNKLAMEAEMSKSSDAIKQMIAKQQGIDSIIEAAMYSKTENYKSDKKLQGDIMKAEKQAETAIKTASMNKDKKKEKATK